MSDSSDSDFEGFLEESFDVRPVVVERHNDPVDTDSDISVDEDLSDVEEDFVGGEVRDDQVFSDRLHSVDVDAFREPTGPRHCCFRMRLRWPTSCYSSLSR